MFKIDCIIFEPNRNCMSENAAWQKMANQIFELDKKVLSKEENTSLQRIYDKMKQIVEEAGVFIYNPKGEKYSETRTDVEANISGNSIDNLIITDVIKPILYTEEAGKKMMLQKGVVIVSGK